MNPVIPPKTPRMLLATTALLALSIGLGVTLTQCKMVTDGLSGAKVDQSANASNCISGCSHAFNDSVRVESDLHVANIKACGSNSACKADEDARHEAALIRLQLGRQDCQNRCHHQGGGGGGR